MRKIEEVKERILAKIVTMPFDFPLPIERTSTLQEVLQQEVEQKYFLSQKTIAGLLKGQSKPQIL